MFAKLYDTEVGQILILKELNEDNGNPEVRFYFQPEGLGTCHMATTMPDDSDGSWDAADKLFDSVDKEKAVSLCKKLIDSFTD